MLIKKAKFKIFYHGLFLQSVCILNITFNDIKYFFNWQFKTNKNKSNFTTNTYFFNSLES